MREIRQRQRKAVEDYWSGLEYFDGRIRSLVRNREYGRAQQDLGNVIELIQQSWYPVTTIGGILETYIPVITADIFLLAEELLTKDDDKIQRRMSYIDEKIGMSTAALESIMGDEKVEFYRTYSKRVLASVG